MLGVLNCKTSSASGELVEFLAQSEEDLHKF